VDKDSVLLEPPINPTPRPCLKVTWISVPWVTWEAVTGVEWTLCRGLLRHTLANEALVNPNQGGSYRAEDCMALGSNSSVAKDPLGEPGRTPLYVGLPSKWYSVDGDRRWALEPERLCLGELCMGSLERGLLYWEV